jgi:hypothetical protein
LHKTSLEGFSSSITRALTINDFPYKFTLTSHS